MSKEICFQKQFKKAIIRTSEVRVLGCLLCGLDALLLCVSTSMFSTFCFLCLKNHQEGCFVLFSGVWFASIDLENIHLWFVLQCKSIVKHFIVFVSMFKDQQLKATCISQKYVWRREIRTTKCNFVFQLHVVYRWPDRKASGRRLDFKLLSPGRGIDPISDRFLSRISRIRLN